MFRILVVDDDPVSANLLQEVMKNLHPRNELHFVWDGAEALDFLHGRGAHSGAARPNLILLDMNMPRLSGLEALSAIKNDPELCVIPVIMLSASNSPQDVRRSYQAHANGYVQKPTDMGRSMKLIQALQAFWADFALPAPVSENLQTLESKNFEPPKSGPAGTGLAIASELAEARSRATRTDDLPAGKIVGCEEHNRLLDAFGEAVHELLKLHEHQFRAIMEGDSECSRFDLLIHMGNEKKQLAKYAYLRHVEAHGCSNFDGIDQTRT
ncbi:MAG: response regulator [Bryobacteraceae bacterium]|jgi:CheY-like chemotaxis protein